MSEVHTGKIAFLGPKGTFTHLAANQHFGANSELKPCSVVEDIFTEVEAQQCQLGIIPIENSSEGFVRPTLDCFKQTTLKICGEVELPVRHHLLTAYPDHQIQKIYSHPFAILQCREYLKAHYPDVVFVETSSTAQAAQLVRSEKDAAAIASIFAREMFDLDVVAKDINDKANNTTRFWIIGNSTPSPTGQDKSTLMLSSENKPGSLVDILTPFAKRGVDLTKIESRPIPERKWQYLFFVDCLGHIQEENLQQVLQDLAQIDASCKVLGSYAIYQK